MKPRHLVAVLALAVAHPRPRLAAADGHKLLVLQSEGRADAATRARVDAAIVKLARATEPQTTAGVLSFTDAATAVGCKPDAASCKDEVLGMLGVDEIVIASVTPKPGGLEIEVHRFARSGATRDARMLVATGGSPDKLDAIGSLFGEPPAAVSEPTLVDPPGSPAPITTEQQLASEGITVLPAEQSKPQPMDPATRRRLEIAGIAGGGGLFAVGLVLWAAASGVQGDINKAPTVTRQDLVDLKNLESKGDTYATLGNVFIITGLVAGGVSTYFYIRDRRAGSSASVARLTPTVFDHGAGLVLTLGAIR